MEKKKVYGIELSKEEAEKFIALLKQEEKQNGKHYLHNVSACYNNTLVEVFCFPSELNSIDSLLAFVW